MTTRTFRVDSGAGEDGLRLGVQDAASGEMLAQIQLSPEDLWRLLKGGSIQIDGRSTDHLDRIGKRMMVDTVNVPRDITDTVSSRDRDREGRLKAAVDWASVTHPNWDAYQAHHTNTGTVRIVLRKWVVSEPWTAAEELGRGKA